MIDDLSDRQTQILKAVIEEYIEDAKPVGSEVLERKYALGVSPATIRNEMVRLTEKGYLKQPFISAGRAPTSKGLRFYVDRLMKEKELSVTEEVAAKEKVWDMRFDPDELMREAVVALAERTKTLAVGGIEGEHVWHAGEGNVLRFQEFYNIDVTHSVLTMLDEMDRINQLFFEGERTPLSVIFGEELGWNYFEPVSMVVGRFATREGRAGCLGVIGPARLNFARIVPNVRLFSQVVNDLVNQA